MVVNSSSPCSFYENTPPASLVDRRTRSRAQLTPPKVGRASRGASLQGRVPLELLQEGQIHPQLDLGLLEDLGPGVAEGRDKNFIGIERMPGPI
jgi:hypothetical protein